MDILPIKSIREEDGVLVGKELVNLAKLYHLKLPVASGIVVFPPQFHLKAALKHFQFYDREIFEQSLPIFRSKMYEIPAPEDFYQELIKYKLDPNKLWLKMLDNWILEIRSKIWREGILTEVTKQLSCQTILFNEARDFGESYFDYELNRLVVKIHQGTISDLNLKKLEEVVLKANKKLLLPQIYHWRVNQKVLEIYKLVPFTQYTPGILDTMLKQSKQVENSLPTEQTVKSSLKIFTTPDSLRLDEDIDGVLISSEQISDFDLKLVQVVEYGLILVDKPVIFKLSDLEQSKTGVRGSLRLIHQKSLLEDDAKVILFARHKKQLLNVSVAVPFVRSVNEFVEVKRQLASLGLTRKGTLKLWLELAVPENIINIEEYLEIGFDGALINLDELSSMIGGFDPNAPECVYYKKQIEGLVKFLQPAVKILHKNKIPILTSGNLALEEEVLKFKLDNGIWGLVVDKTDHGSIREHLYFMEKKHLRAKLA